MKAAVKVRLLSRNGKDFTKRFAAIAAALENLPDETVNDGEIVAYDADRVLARLVRVDSGPKTGGVPGGADSAWHGFPI
jgi:hypothetical protein